MSDTVELVIPVNADLIVLARMTAATVASRAQFDVEEIEDLRLAVDELCISLVQGSTVGQLTLQFIRDDDDIEVTCAYQAPPDHDDPWDEAESLTGLSARILDALVDDHGVAQEGSQRRAWLRKRRARQPA
jgi:anti-sigma regulatory factor (Ser/Thr protein kinase)